MKNTQLCPKCEANNIIKVPFRNVVGQDAVKLGVLNFVYLNYYICADCGYTEQWVDNQKSLDKLKLKSVKRDWYLK